MNVNVNLMGESLIQNNSGIKDQVDASTKIQESIVCAKIVFGIPVQGLVKIVNI